MKKIFFFALASLALASCSQDEEFAPEKSTNGSSRANGGALSFSSYAAGLTRSTGDATVDAIKAGFGVSAIYGSEMYITNEVAKNNLGYLNGAGNRTDASDGIWDTENTYYWPAGLSSSSPISFYANNLQITMGTTPAKTGAVDGTLANQLKYEVNATAATQEDLVVASAVAEAQPATGVQPLHFAHAMSKINFTLKGADTDDQYTYTINKIEVVANGGESVCQINDVTTNNAGGKADAFVAPTWVSVPKVNNNNKPNIPYDASATETNKGGVVYTYVDGDQVLNKDNDFTLELGEDMLLMPQAENVVLRIYYKIESSKNSVVYNCGYAQTGDVYGYKSVVVKKADAATALWEAGKNYRYTLTLPLTSYVGDLDSDGRPDDLIGDADYDGDGDTGASEFFKALPIRFSVTLEAWDDESNNAIAIQ